MILCKTAGDCISIAIAAASCGIWHCDGDISIVIIILIVIFCSDSHDFLARSNNNNNNNKWKV